jgi:tetratricopeptide (TPR) repeat protein
LSADAVASASSAGHATDIVLQRGSIQLDVLPQAPGHQLSVIAGPYRFTVVGTVFSVSHSQSRSQLVVEEGAVAVSRGARRLTLVQAGGRWSEDDTQISDGEVRPGARAPAEWPKPADRQARPERLAPGTEQASAAQALLPPAPPAPAPPAQALAASVSEPPRAAQRGLPSSEDCRSLTQDRTQEALACYEKQAMRSGLAGETAAYELARLWRELGHADRALAAFESQRARFPDGVLRGEAELSIIELLPRLGRHGEALQASQRYLAAHPEDAHTGELHLLRGNIYREALHDLDHAQREYALGAKGKGRVGDDNQFFHAVCLEALGRTVEARLAYQAYLRRRDAAHAAEAEKRLAGLAP